VRIANRLAAAALVAAMLTVFPDILAEAAHRYGRAQRDDLVDALCKAALPWGAIR